MRPSLRWSAVALVCVAACSGGSSVVGGPDAQSDLGVADVAQDAGPDDLGAFDAGPADVVADQPAADAGPADAGLDASDDAADADMADGSSTDGTVALDAPDAPDASDGGAGCDAGESVCASDGGTLCVSLDRDPAHCGACGQACTGGALCRDGRCGCAESEARCGDRCIDISADSAHCGACDRACPSPSVCLQGQCRCPAGQTLCGARCIDLRTDEDHCGACDTVCPTGQVCTLGACACPRGTTLCAGRCVTPDSDNGHCGACGNACGEGARCTAGACVCPEGQRLCAGRCVNPASDGAHCGACGNACGEGRVCAAGTCQLTCSTPLTVCGAGSAQRCVDPRTDESHCGTCGTVCGTLEVCTAGVCSCAPGLTRCSGACVDTARSGDHCGACGTRCTGPGVASGVCAAGRCQLTCTTGFGDCDGDPANGCERNLATSDDHCGACGTRCEAVGLGARCVAGRCGAASCAAVLATRPDAANGVYLLDLDGTGPAPARGYYCDMTGGGWTLVANQVPEAPLPDTAATVNAAGFGTLSQSYRLGGSEITALRPSIAWRLTDNANAVFFTPACTVDWNVNYTTIMSPTPCTVGYTSTAFTTVFNGRWVYCSAKGIGINNSGQFCSMRMHEGGPASQGAMAHGRAATCLYRVDQRVSLWFR
jgi:hypothetical protein